MGGLSSIVSSLAPSSVIGTVGGALIGGGASYLGAKETNQSNERIASARNLFEEQEAEKARGFSSKEAQILRNFTSEEAKKQMGFQEHMSSTAIQRRMADMKKAGINPILAGKYDASTPAGAMGSGSQPATAKANSQGYTAINEIQPFLDNLGTALQLRKLSHEAEKAEHDAGISKNVKEIGDPASNVMSDAENLYTTAKKALQDKNLRSDIVKTVRDAGSSTSKALKNVTDNISVKLGKIAQPIQHMGKEWNQHKEGLKTKRELGYIFGWDKDGVPIYQYERNKHKLIKRWRK